MKIFNVIWTLEPELAKGKPKDKSREIVFGFKVLCNNRKDVLRCLFWYWQNRFKDSATYEIDDGTLTITLCKVDSRGFYPHYLLVDKMIEPIELSSVESSLFRLAKHYYLPF